MTQNRIGVVKDNSVHVQEPNLEPTENLVITLDWFDDKHFAFRAKDVQKEIVKERLQNLDKQDFNFKETEIKKKERVVVHRKPNYKMGQAVFDETILMPVNLSKKKSRAVLSRG